MIAIVDYGMGNLFSIYNALDHIGASPQIITQSSELQKADGIVVPGVGSFGMCMERLGPFEGDLREALDRGVPMLGICIGMQVLFEHSEESPEAHGFGWLEGEVIKLPAGVMIPQMGWNEISINSKVEILDGISEGDRFYFVHSYHCVPSDNSLVVATTHHGIDIVAVVLRDNLCATQFHPEKSGPKGLMILENFARSTRC